MELVALQEVRSDQINELALLAKMPYFEFAATRTLVHGEGTFVEGSTYGIAVLSKFKICEKRVIDFRHWRLRNDRTWWWWWCLFVIIDLVLLMILIN